MIREPRYDGTGATIVEYLKTVAYDLAHDDTVGMWQIVPAGRLGFGLSGTELDAFVKQYIRTLLEAGAKPVRAFNLPNELWEWRAQTQYGHDFESTAQAIIDDWHNIGSPDPEWGWLRFELPQYINKPTSKGKSPRATSN
jgi:hypothetical protein